jgi:hypothetical protein
MSKNDFHPNNEKKAPAPTDLWQLSEYIASI